MLGRSFLSIASLALAIRFVAAPSLHAQSAVAVDGGITSLGEGYGSISVFETGVRFGSLKPKQVNADVRFATSPKALMSGLIVLAADIDAAFVLPLGQGMVATPRAGVSLLAGVSGEGGGGVPGVNFGLGVVAGLTSPLGVRFDYTHRTYLVGEGEGIGATSFTIGIVWVH
jgi:hypothetical protein